VNVLTNSKDMNELVEYCKHHMLEFDFSRELIVRLPDGTFLRRSKVSTDCYDQFLIDLKFVMNTYKPPL